jgi:hypothetical protein
MLGGMITDIVDFLSAGGWVPACLLVLIGLGYGVNAATSGISEHAYNKSRPR